MDRRIEVVLNGTVVGTYPDNGDYAACAARDLLLAGHKDVKVKCSKCQKAVKECKCLPSFASH